MHHIVLFLQVTSLILGAWTILYLHQLNKTYHNKLIQAFKYFVIVFNLRLLDEMVIKYIITNLTSNNPEWINVFYIFFHHPVNLFLTITLIYCFLRMAFELSEKPFNRYINLAFWTGTIILTINLTAGIFIYVKEFSAQWIDRTNSFAGNLLAVVVFITVIYLLLFKGALKNTAKSKAINVFACFYLIGFIFPYIDFIFSFNEFNHLFSLLFLFMNIFPIIWIRNYYLKYFLFDNILDENKMAFDSLAKEYKISRRESEIIELILQGKSNKEIEDILFISFHTVKNHIYNLYQKFGLNSRTQLFHFVHSKLKNNKLNT